MAISRKQPRSETDYDATLREFTKEELTFLKLHAQHGPIVRSTVAAALLGFENESELKKSATSRKTPLDIFRPGGRFKVTFVAAIPLANLMVARGLEVPDAPIPEPWSFSRDDTAGPEILMLDRALSAEEFRAMTLTQLTALRMHARYGPLLTSAKAAQLLAFPASGPLIQAIRAGRVPLRMVVPTGRHKAFASTRAVARYLAELALAHEAVPKYPTV